ncbi:MAG: gluconolactonase [Bacteroidetes bacterium QS_1_63_11]|nr:MAG: gluconolactonase [Bacteroidetes bacterium QS_1_63_11]
MIGPLRFSFWAIIRHSPDVVRAWTVPILVGLVFVLCASPPAQAQSPPVPEGVTVEKVADGFEFTEGPLWHDGRLVFSDIPADRVYQWAPEEGHSVFLAPSGHANGLSTDSDGHLLLAQHDGQVARLTTEGEIEPLVSSYQGNRLNSPNDLTVADDGTIYFTDPPYGVDAENRELDFAGVYRLDPDGTLTLLTTEFDRPNGIVLSPDESILYVNDTDGDLIRAYDVTENGDIADGRVFAEMEGKAPGNADGMKIDADGNLYTTGPGGIWIYTPDGELLDRMSVPEGPTNLAFGGPERRTLYITAQSNVYRIPLRVPGAE